MVRACFLVACLCLLTVHAFAIIPPYVSDDDLAQYPIIVVAHWDKSPLTPHHLIEGEICKE